MQKLIQLPLPEEINDAATAMAERYKLPKREVVLTVLEAALLTDTGVHMMLPSLQERAETYKGERRRARAKREEHYQQRLLDRKEARRPEVEARRRARETARMPPRPTKKEAERARKEAAWEERKAVRRRLGLPEEELFGG
jgi:hypothetical protein